MPAAFAHFLAITGRVEEALPHSQRAINLDPFSALYHGLQAEVLIAARRFDDALAAARAGLNLQPGGVADGARQAALICKGMRDELLSNQRERIARDPERVAAFEQGLRQGGYEGAQRGLADLLAARYEKARGIPNAGAARVYMPMAIALRYVDAGDYEETIRWYEEAYRVRDPNLPYIGVDPLNDPLRADPRFQDLLRRMKLPQQ